MRVSFIPFLALSGLCLSSPVVDRRADVVSLLTSLYSTIQTHTAAINATIAPLSASSSSVLKDAAIAKVGPEFTSITAALKSTTSSVKALTPGCSVKRSSLERSVGVGAQPVEKRQLAEVGTLLASIVDELLGTVEGVVAVLGLSGLLTFLNPLTGGLGALILSVEVLLDVLLVGVIALLNNLLTGLALGLGGL